MRWAELVAYRAASEVAGKAAFFVLTILAAISLAEAGAGDAETIAEVNKAAAALDEAFEQQDVDNVKQLMTPDHIAVTHYRGAD